MTDHEGDFRGFYHYGEAWYSKGVSVKDDRDHVELGFYSPGGGTSGEFNITWVDLGGKPSPQLRAFDDSWDALWLCRDVLEALAKLDGTDPTPKQICALLLELGFKDLTDREPRKIKGETDRIRESALAKLSDAEKKALGLTP